MTFYTITRYYRAGHPSETVETGLTIDEAKAHCNDPETSSATATSQEAFERTLAKGAWFHGFTEE